MTNRTPGGGAADWAGIVLAGGAGSRMGGVDKAALQVDGRTLLERARAALVGAEVVSVVGPEVAGGPAVALLEGARRVGTAWLVVLAVDMPWATPATVARLLGAADGHDGALLDDGRRQYLAAAYRRSSLPASVPEGTSMRRLTSGLDLVLVPAEGDEARDIDTWSDLPSDLHPCDTRPDSPSSYS